MYTNMGQIKPLSIGKALSHGCMRLKPKDARTFFKSIEVGMQGEIIYQPIKIAIKGNIVLMEVHKDVYGKVPDMYRHALKMIYALDLVDKVDFQRVKNTVEYKSGVPEIISPVDNNASSTAKLESLRPGGNLGFD